MSEAEFRSRLDRLAARPTLTRSGVPPHRSWWGNSRVLTGVSRGPGLAVPLRNPLGRRPRRVEPFAAGDTATLDAARTTERFLVVQPDAPAGQRFTILVE